MITSQRVLMNWPSREVTSWRLLSRIQTVWQAGGCASSGDGRWEEPPHNIGTIGTTLISSGLNGVQNYQRRGHELWCCTLQAFTEKNYWLTWRIYKISWVDKLHSCKFVCGWKMIRLLVLSHMINLFQIKKSLQFYDVNLTQIREDLTKLIIIFFCKKFNDKSSVYFAIVLSWCRIYLTLFWKIIK